MKKVICLLSTAVLLFAFTKEEDFNIKTFGGACGSAIVATSKANFGTDQTKVTNACQQCVKEKINHFEKSNEIEQAMISVCIDSYFKK